MRGQSSCIYINECHVGNYSKSEYLNRILFVPSIYYVINVRIGQCGVLQSHCVYNL